MRKHYTSLFISLGVFILCMLLLWIGGDPAKGGDATLGYVAALYTIICFSFLVFQVYAFARAHIIYDQDIEEVKLQIFDLEGMSDEQDQFYK
jgi:F0F1-type ATP synthase assembly protein I